MRKFGIITLFILIAFLAAPVMADEASLQDASPQDASSQNVPVQTFLLLVYYDGADGNVKTALELAKFNPVSDLSAADVIVLNGAIPDPKAVAARVQAGAGLILVIGPEIIGKTGKIPNSGIGVVTVTNPVGNQNIIGR